MLPFPGADNVEEIVELYFLGATPELLCPEASDRRAAAFLQSCGGLRKTVSDAG